MYMQCCLIFPFYLHSFGSWSFVKQSAWFFQVLGNAKGAVAVVVSILIFRNPVSVTGMLGYSLTVLGVLLYSEAKKRSKWDHSGRALNILVFSKGRQLQPNVEASLEHMPAVVAWVLPSKFYFLPGSLTDWLPLVSATNPGFSQQVEKFNKWPDMPLLFPAWGIGGMSFYFYFLFFQERIVELGLSTQSVCYQHFLYWLN